MELDVAQPRHACGVVREARCDQVSSDGRKLTFAPFPWEERGQAAGILVLDLETGKAVPRPGSKPVFSSRWPPEVERDSKHIYSRAGDRVQRLGLNGAEETVADLSGIRLTGSVMALGLASRPMSR